MKVFHINEFKCTLCSNWFCPPFTLPYRLKCTHSICTNCLQKSVENHSNQIICPEDLQTNKISQITINQSTKKALQRLLKEHKNLAQTNHLQCIKSLSLTFDQILDSKQIQMKNLSSLIDQIFENQIKRLREIYEKIKIQINRPFRIVNDWKEVVRNYLKKVKNQGQNAKGCITEFNHYIEEGRKIKFDLNEYLKHDFKELIQNLLLQPQICFTHTFSIFDHIENQASDKKYLNTGKFQTLGKRLESVGKKSNEKKQIYLQDLTNNLDQSSIRGEKQKGEYNQQNQKKLSLFQSLIQQTPKNEKCYNSQIYQGSKKTVLNQLIFSSVQNIENQKLLTQKNFNQDKKKQNKNFKLKPNDSQENKIDRSQMKKNVYSTLQSSQKNQNNLIMQKIYKIKQNDEKKSFKKPIKMGKSLEYSPDQPNYEVSHPYTIHDSFEEQAISYQNNQNISLHSFHQNQTTLLSPEKKLQLKNITQFKSTLSKQIDDQQEQLLLDQKSAQNEISNLNIKRNEWSLQHLNFLKEWKVQKGIKGNQQLEVIQKYGGYDCEKEKNKYARKIQELRVKEVLKQTTVCENFISIVGQNLAECNLVLLLSQIDWNYRNIEIVKFIKTGLTDIQLNQLLNFLVRSQVHTLMLSYNNLTELSLDALLHFVTLNSTLKNIYLPKNNISLLKGNARTKINLLKQKGINLYI